MEDDRLMPKSTTTDHDHEAVVVVSKDVVVAEENPGSQDAKHVEFSIDEETLIIRMFNLVGERWSLIAGRIPGRSAEEIEKYWNSKHSTCSSEHKKPEILINLN